ncbi:unnamed protein product [Bursaphelenchus xylophilus]|uniref:(pine wood nematode) hypothetical protein n=1 Tax=Bursaphelenchus xylophilus TaxID=6326 RepID=A0A1I7RT97_BURXY|nr:unnamed protein product [Bursaphelenchus xylophilus]CAG9122528.1 unnamed protein product [Bursaphelenchus xylophilus]
MPVIARSSALKSCASLADVEKLAKQRLAVAVRDFISAGADGQWTLERNSSQFKKYLLRQKIPDDAFEINLKCRFTMKNRDFSYEMPIGMAPIPLHGLVHAKAEEPMVKVASSLKIPAIASLLSNLSYQEISEIERPNESWMQVYIPEDMDHTLKGIELIQTVGYKALVISVGCPIDGRRRSDERNQFGLPSHLKYGNFRYFRRVSPNETFQDSQSEKIRINTSLTFDWKQLETIVKHSDIPVILKGILRGDEAEKAVQVGCSAVYVSNHGGRQLDYAPATIECLPEIFKAVNNRIPIFLDGGIRSGCDVVKAISLGADLVFIGRPYIYGLSLGGQPGITQVFDILRQELMGAMRMAGYHDADSIKHDSKHNQVVHESYYRNIKL